MTTEYMRPGNLEHGSQMLQSTSFLTDIASVDRVAEHNRLSYVRYDAPSGMERPSSACRLCGQWHSVRFRTYRRHVCQQCNRMGHKQSHCSQSTWRLSLRRQSNVMCTRASKIFHRQKYMTLHIGNQQVRLQINSASDNKTILLLAWINFGRPLYRLTNRAVKSAGEYQISFLGELPCTFHFRDKYGSDVYHTCPNNHQNLLGLY
ncbi:uncharacterized protein DEA37_0012586 [Paragonimus westermani]|uniref:Uncharacterized protein n=1 Tax=Paragonimus westermani TaxID=34504 RepID=A0A5J4NA48_9TREM|nr:uncharacterized protein DEA37_0012586 [Paragonimus westermani]